MLARAFEDLGARIPAVEALPEQGLRVCVNVPVHNEFANGTLFRFLAAMANQTSIDFNAFEINFLVNNLSQKNFDEGPGEDNLASLAILKALADRTEVASSLESSQFSSNPVMHQVYNLAKQAGLRINVFDATDRQLATIGEARDYLAEIALQRLKDVEAHEHGIVVQMDADVQVESRYIAKILSEFQNPNIDTVIASDLLVAESLVPRYAAHFFVMKFKREANIYLSRTASPTFNPLVHSFRIVARANVLREIGGVPHLSVDEDFALFENLRRHGKLKFTDSIWVNHEDRVRMEGWDSLSTLFQLDEYDETAADNFREEQLSLGEIIYSQILSDCIKSGHLSESEIEQIRQKYILKREQQHNQRRLHLLELIRKLVVGEPLDEMEVMTSSSNPWIGIKVRVLVTEGANFEEIVATLNRDYPDWLVEFDKTKNAQYLAWIEVINKVIEVKKQTK